MVLRCYLLTINECVEASLQMLSRDKRRKERSKFRPSAMLPSAKQM
jgi:hypothetical protein